MAENRSMSISSRICVRIDVHPLKWMYVPLTLTSRDSREVAATNPINIRCYKLQVLNDRSIYICA